MQQQQLWNKCTTFQGDDFQRIKFFGYIHTGTLKNDQSYYFTDSLSTV